MFYRDLLAFYTFDTIDTKTKPAWARLLWSYQITRKVVRRGTWYQINCTSMNHRWQYRLLWQLVSRK